MPEFNAGSLTSMQSKMPGGIFNEKQIRLIGKQIINGLIGLHQNKIVHYDLKHENILVHFDDYNKKKSLEKFLKRWDKEELKLVVADYGESKF